MVYARLKPVVDCASLARAFMLGVSPLLAIACSSDRPTEPQAGGGLRSSVATVDCSNGCKDTFTDAEDTPLAAHTADVGGFTWSPVPGWQNDARILGNAVGVKGADTLDQSFQYLVPEIVGLDSVELEIELFGDPNTAQDGTSVPFITLRGDGTFEGGYKVWLQVSFGSASVGFERNNQPLPAGGASTSVPYPGQGIHKFRAEASGGSIKAYLDGVLVTSVTDPSPLPAGHPGFGLTTLISGYGHESQVRITSFRMVKVICPTGDATLDSEAARDLLRIAWDSSNAFDPIKQNRRERGGYVFRDSSGNLVYRTYFAATDTPCRANVSPTGPLPGSFVAGFHTHPFSGDTTGTSQIMGEETTGICSLAVPGQQKFYDASTYGGPSIDDFTRGTDDNLPMYVLDKDNIYFFPVGTTKSTWKSKVKSYPRRDPSGCTRP